MSLNIAVLDWGNPRFPDPQTALDSPPGLLAVGGNLHPSTLLEAYRQGIFPWYSDGEPLLWWSPDPRCLINPGSVHISKSLRKTLRREDYRVTTNHAFKQVVGACAAPREDAAGTWITDEMQQAYCALHALGHAHSVEVWHNDILIGGLYGIAVGALFCGESMFSRATNGSKIAMAHLCNTLHRKGFRAIDCQLVNPHLLTLGATPVRREDFLELLAACRDITCVWPSDMVCDWH